jgi:hypothetical protein
MKALDLRVVCAAWKRDLTATHLDVCHSHLVYFRILPRIKQIDENKSWILHFKTACWRCDFATYELKI